MENTYLRMLQNATNDKDEIFGVDRDVSYVIRFLIVFGALAICVAYQFLCLSKPEDPDPYNERPSQDASDGTDMVPVVLTNAEGKEYVVAQPLEQYRKSQELDEMRKLEEETQRQKAAEAEEAQRTSVGAVEVTQEEPQPSSEEPLVAQVTQGDETQTPAEAQTAVEAEKAL